VNFIEIGLRWLNGESKAMGIGLLELARAALVRFRATKNSVVILHLIAIYTIVIA
jgi:hypothetical protein